MSARLRFLDRLGSVLAGLPLCAIGAFLALWGLPTSVRGGVSWLQWVPTQSPLAGAEQVPAASWFPAVVALVALVCGLKGAIWLVAHLRRRRVGALVLDGDGDTGQLDVAASTVVDAAALELNTHPGVDSAVGAFRLVDSDKHRVARVEAAVDAEADLRELAATADRLSRQLRAVTGRDDLEFSVILRTQHNRPDRVE